jgi:hypothetical protein
MGQRLLRRERWERDPIERVEGKAAGNHDRVAFVRQQGGFQRQKSGRCQGRSGIDHGERAEYVSVKRP